MATENLPLSLATIVNLSRLRNRNRSYEGIIDRVFVEETEMRQIFVGE